jgi:endonuclease YncB( thermonuclease family)
MIRARALAVLLVTAVGPRPLAAAELIVGKASVVDGDTLEIRGERIRLFGIDAPEAAQTCTDAGGNVYRCGQRAALVLDARIGDGVVTCERKDRDRYGRPVAICRAYGEDLGAWLVGLGWAVALRKYSTRYVPAEELAQKRKAGMWAGRFQIPSEWREKRQPSAARSLDARTLDN